MESKQKKFNIVDVLVLLVLVAGIVFLLLRVTGAKSVLDTSQSEDFVMTFSGETVHDYVADRIELGAPVTNDECTLEMGSVIDVITDTAVSYNVNAAGETVVSDKPGYYSIKLVCKVSAEDNGNGITINGNKFGVGHTMVVRAGDAKLYLNVSDIQKYSEYAGEN